MKTNLRKEMDAELKAKHAPQRKAKLLKVAAIGQAIVIATALLLAVGFYFGNVYANNKHTEQSQAVESGVDQAVERLKVSPEVAKQ